jgi:hypothetical protein
MQKPFRPRPLSALCWFIGLALTLWASHSAAEAQPAAVTPPAPPQPELTLSTEEVLSDFAGTLKVSVTGLSAGQSVTIERFLDVDGSGDIGPADRLVRSYRIADGEVRSIGGVPNPNLPHDEDRQANGIIALTLDLTGDYGLNRVAGRYLYRVSDPAGNSAPRTKPFTIQPKSFPQGVAGTLSEAGTGKPLSGGVVALVNLVAQEQVATGFTDEAGHFAISGAPGLYFALALHPGHVARAEVTRLEELSTLLVPVLPGETTTHDVALVPADRTIVGRLSDAASSGGLGGVFIYAVAAGENSMSFGYTFVEAEGTFTLPVTAGEWTLTLPTETLPRLGYVSRANLPPVDARAGGVIGLNLQLPSATALIDGELRGEDGRPLVDVEVHAHEAKQGFETVTRSDSRGQFVLGVTEGTWEVSVDPAAVDALGFAGQSVSVAAAKNQATRRDLVFYPIPAPHAATGNWHWRNPLPQGNRSTGVAFGNGTFVAVGFNGMILTSLDGENWTIRSQGEHGYLFSVAFGGGKFVAVGYDGMVVSSPDGVEWTRQNAVTDKALYAVAFGGDHFVAVGEAGTALSSSDGVTWENVNAATSEELQAVAFGNGVFVAVGFNGTIVTSSNGSRWTARTSGTNQILLGVGFGNGTFVAGGQGGATLGDSATLLTSPDGATWTPQDAGVSEELSEVTFADGRFVAVGRNGTVLVSTDGKNWELHHHGRFNSEYSDLFGVVRGTDGWVAVGEAGAIFGSTDGNAWRPLRSGERLTLADVTYGDGRFVAVGEDGRVWLSSDGSGWQAQRAGLGFPLYRVAFGRGRFVTIGGATTVLVSPDGVNWVPARVPVTSRLKAVAYGNDRFVIGGDNGVILTSFDGLNWKLAETGTTDPIESLACGEGLCVAGGLAGTVWTSTDGEKWTSHDTETSESFADLTFGQGRFVAALSSGRTAVSTDGVRWSVQETTRAEGLLESVAYGQNHFIAVSSRGEILASADGFHWKLHAPISDRLAGVAFGQATFVAVGDGGTVLQSEPLLLGYPEITQTPLSQTAAPGARVMLRATVSGPGPLTYQWHKGGAPMVGATSESLVLENVQAADAGDYSVVVSNASGSVASGPATLLVERLSSLPLSRWRRRSGAPADAALWSVASGNGSLVVVGNGGLILWSNDGSAWLPFTSGTDRPLFGVAHGAGHFVAVGDEGVALKSEGGIVWSSVNTGTTQPLFNVGFGAGVFVAVGAEGTMLLSNDGTAWTAQTTPVNSDLTAVASGNGIFVAVGLGGTVLSSADGRIWTERESGLEEDLWFVAFGSDRFVAVGNGARLITSPDGVSWETVPVPTNDDLWSVAYGNGRFVVATLSGKLLFSEDGRAWTLADSGQPEGLVGLTYANGTFVGVGAAGTILESDPLVRLSIVGGPSSELVLSGPSNRILRLESVDELQATNSWTWLTWLYPAEPVQRLPISDFSTSPRRFYRAVVIE